MKILDIPQFWMPENIASAPDTNGSANLDINGPNDYFAYVFSMPETATITECYFNFFSVATGGDIQVRLETVSPTTLLPTGTLIDTNAVVTKTITTATTGDFATFPTGVTIQAGTMVAYVIKGVSATVSAFVATFADSHNSTTIPICIDYDSATTIARRISAAPLIGLKTQTSGIPIRHTWPVTSFAVKTINSTGISSAGNSFILVEEAWTITGARLWLSMASGATARVALYDNYGGLIRATNLIANTPASSANYMREVYFSSPITLTGGAATASPDDFTYYLVVEGTSTASVGLAIMTHANGYTKASPLNWKLRGAENSGFGFSNTFGQAFITPIVTSVDPNGFILNNKANSTCFAS